MEGTSPSLDKGVNKDERQLSKNEANEVVKCCGRWSRLVLVFADCAMSLGRVKRYKHRFVSAQSAEVLCRKVSTDVRLKVVG